MTVVASVIVAVHGNVDALDGLLGCLAKQDFPGHLQVIVVDNHRWPHVPVYLGTDTWAGFVRVVHEPRPGLSRARNVALQHAVGDYLLFTDPDARPEAGWVRALIDALTNTGAYCAGGRLTPRFVDHSTPPTLESGVQQFFLPTIWPARTCRLQEPFWLAGCNLATRNSPPPWFAEELGARPRRHLSCEDLELTFRATELGVVVVPDAVVHRAVHRRDLQLRALLARGWWHGVSVARMQQRHPGAAIYDTTRARAVLRGFRWSHRRTAAIHLSRIVAWRMESLRLTLARHIRSSPRSASEGVTP